MRLYILAVPMLAAAAWAQAPAPALPEGVVLDANIAYDRYPETRLDIVRPKAPAKGKRPGVLVIHGGGWVNGSKEAQIAPFCLRYVEQGFVCASRGVPAGEGGDRACRRHRRAQGRCSGSATMRAGTTWTPNASW